MGGQYSVPIAGLSLQGSNFGNNQTSINQQSLITNSLSVPNTNTNQSSSWLSAIEGYPSDIYNTVAGVANWFASPFEQYRAGGTPLAGGQFLNANVVKPTEQFEQGVLNTPLPSLQQLEASMATPQSNLPLLYLQGIPQATLAPTQPTQQPTTIGSLLSSADQTFNNALNNLGCRIFKYLFFRIQIKSLQQGFTFSLRLQPLLFTYAILSDDSLFETTCNTLFKNHSKFLSNNLPRLFKIYNPAKVSKENLLNRSSLFCMFR
ncbi:MAG: hypothetical protein QXN16_03870 [Candidatus Micrarchaeaceae archaeon]